MNLKELREEAWAEARDLGKNDDQRLWKTPEMNGYINRVYRRIARETKCIRDSVTPEICQIPVQVVDYTTLAPGTLDYQWANDPSSWLYHENVAPYLLPLDPRILVIEEVKWTIQPWKLTKQSVVAWQQNPWWEQVKGMPTQYATDLSNNAIALNFRNTASDTLRLQVRRMPLTDLTADADEPEFRAEYHDFFKYGVLELMYAKQDTETIDATKSLDYGGRFREDLDRAKMEETRLQNHLHSNGSLEAFR